MDKIAPDSARRLDELGRIVIPEAIRSALGWQPGDRLTVELQDTETASVVIRPEKIRCSLCHSAAEDLASFRSGHICPQCREQLASR